MFALAAKGVSGADVLTQAQWTQAITAVTRPIVSIGAVDFVYKWPSASLPVEVVCSRGPNRVLKSLLLGNPNSNRCVFTDHVLGRAGQAVGAPVPEVDLVMVPSDLIAAEPEMQHMIPGIAHATRRMIDCTDKLWPPAPKTAANRRQVASIAIFYGWIAGINDKQIIKELHPPEDFYSVDHGHFLPSGPNWTVDTLDAFATTAVPEPDCGQLVNTAELKTAARPLSSVTDGDIAGFVASAPDDWGITMNERVALAAFLSRRRDELLATLGV